jgi:hypothetical protein
MTLKPAPEFRVPLSKLACGMVLAKQVTYGASPLLSAGAVLDESLIEKLRSFHVDYAVVRFDDGDIPTVKRLIVGLDEPPPPEEVSKTSRDFLMNAVPPFARPHMCARTPQIFSAVQEAAENTLDILFSSARLFSLLEETGFFQPSVVRHCPVAWMYALCVGAALGYNQPSLLDLSVAALFYDIGMTRVSSRVVAKPGKLTEMEYAEIRKHTHFGKRILEEISPISDAAATVAFEHHESYAGGGYPRGVNGDALHEYSQIVSLTDKYAALMTDRGHRRRFQPYQAYEMMLDETKKSVSPDVFNAFLKSVLIYPKGSFLKLSNGEIGTIADFHDAVPARPTVEIVYDASGVDVTAQKKRIDLADNPEITIESFAVFETGETPSHRQHGYG